MLDVRLADPDDVETLVRLRLDFNDEWHPHSDEEHAEFAAQFRQYFAAGFDAGSFVGVLGFVGSALASGAFLMIDDYPANCVIRHGRHGTLINVYTYPEYRRQGFGEQVVAVAIAKGRELGLDVIDLEATDVARGVYQRLGFEPREHSPMRLVLGSD